MVDEDTGQAVPDRPLHDGRGDRRVDATAEAADRPAGVADLLADALDLLLDDVHHRPGGPAAGDPEQEVLEHLLAVLGVHHLGVPLHPGEATGRVLERGDRGGRGLREDVETFGGPPDGVPVGHPDPVVLRELGEQGARGGDQDRRTTELGDAGVGDLAAEDLRHRLEAVAHPEDRDLGLEQRRVDRGRARRVDRGRPTRQDDRGRVPGQHLGDRQVVRDDLGVDLRLAHSAGDELGVLGSEVDDENEVVVAQDGPFGAESRRPRVCQRFFWDFPRVRITHFLRPR